LHRVCVGRLGSSFYHCGTLVDRIRQLNPLCTLCPSMHHIRVLSKYGHWLSTISQHWDINAPCQRCQPAFCKLRLHFPCSEFRPWLSLLFHVPSPPSGFCPVLLPASPLHNTTMLPSELLLRKEIGSENANYGDERYGIYLTLLLVSVPYYCSSRDMYPQRRL
jgi:hypothetical protein